MIVDRPFLYDWCFPDSVPKSSVKSTAKCRVKSNATIENHSILEDGRDTSVESILKG
jgi:hypothetical protein